MTTKLTVARQIACDAFIQILEQRKDPYITLEQFYAKHPHLKRIDRNLVKEIVFGSLRWYSKIYWILQKLSRRKLLTLSPQVRSSLVLGTYQIFYMDRIPDRAAVNESVEYIRHCSEFKAVSFVNGMLRAVARRSEYFVKPDKDKYPAQYLALQYAHPEWLVKRWFHRFYFERIKTILTMNNQVPPYTIRVNTSKILLSNLEELRIKLLKQERIGSDRCGLRSCLVLSGAPCVEEGSLFAQGYFTIQDEAAQLISLLVNPQKDEYIVDACSGPGGKTCHLVELSAAVEGVKIVAVECNAEQIKRARDTAKRLGHNEKIKWHEGDFLKYQPNHSVDKILLDAPCSGLGVIRRHPEGKWHKKPDIVSKMVKLQKDLLVHALNILKPGGSLIYSVCSFEVEETDQQLSWLQEHYQDKIKVISPINYLPNYYKRFVTRDNILLIFSGNKNSMDGFGAFIITKSADSWSK